MDKSDFANSPSGKVVRTIGNQFAFVPNPLPPNFPLGEVAADLALASQALGELNGIGRTLDNPFLF
jgi:hypothetical protein